MEVIKYDVTVKNKHMKTRNGFVSNSSSSSFVVSSSVLDEKDKRKFLDYEKYSSGDDHKDSWDINIDDYRGVIVGYTTMDNGDLDDYLGEELSGKCIYSSF